MKRISLVMGIVLAALVVAAAPTANARGRDLPATIALPNGFQPEGVATGRGATIYAGSLRDGSVYRADLRTGEGSLVVPPQEGRVAVGLKYDRRTDALFVAGGAAGSAYVYDATTGESLAAYQFTTEASFVNDVVITKDAAYFTDSARPVLYRVPLGRGGRLPAPNDVETIALGGDFEFVPGAFNANGIEAARNGKDLIVVNSTVGALYRVDPDTGDATRIDLGGASVQRGDGILLLGRTLYVVQNRFNQIAVIRLQGDLSTGTVVGTITDARFDVPTTIAAYKGGLYAVNARFGTPPTPDTTYTIVRVPRR